LLQQIQSSKTELIANACLIETTSQQISQQFNYLFQLFMKNNTN